jgi:hypothetical protein
MAVMSIERHNWALSDFGVELFHKPLQQYDKSFHRQEVFLSLSFMFSTRDSLVILLGATCLPGTAGLQALGQLLQVCRSFNLLRFAFGRNSRNWNGLVNSDMNRFSSFPFVLKTRDKDDINHQLPRSNVLSRELSFLSVAVPESDVREYCWADVLDPV